MAGGGEGVLPLGSERRPRRPPLGMGGSGSRAGGRSVSFGRDERDRVRVLQGVRVRGHAGDGG